jgi:MYXO-CTERM domain-containing protein
VGRQTGHFTIQRGDDYLLVNGHQWKQSKVTSGSVTTGYQGPGYVGNTFVYPSSEWNNVLYVDDGPGGYLYDDDYYRGGQLGFNENVPYLVSQRMDATYVKSDATNAYLDNRLLSGFADRAVLLCLRNFVFFTPGNFVVFDRVRLKDAAYKYDLRFYFNSNSPPVITDGIASSTIGASRLFMRTILPQDARLTTAWQQLSGANFVPRVEVRPAAATTTFDALTVFTAAPSDFPAMPDARVIRTESESMVGAHILEPQLERVALFASADTGQVSGDIAYSLASQRARHYLFDLMPATSYTVTASATGDGARVAVAPGAGGITTDAAGVLAFDLEGTTVTPIPDDPAPPSTEQPRTPPPPRPASSASLDGGCGCSAGPTGDAAARTPLGAFAAGVVAAAMLWRLRRRTRQRSGGEREPARVLPGA